MKKRIQIAGLLGVVAVTAKSTVMAAAPNVVLILMDDIGVGWSPPYAERITPADVEELIVKKYEAKRNGGGPINVQKHIEAARNCMPYVSKLAKEGAVFDRCFATASLCAPSRSGLMTGSFQQRWGAYDLADVDEYGVPADRTMLAEPLKASGYRCGVIGKWHLAKKDETLKEKGTKGGGAAYGSSSISGQHPLDRGFDYYFGYNSHGDKYYESDTLWENHDRVPKRPKGEFLTDLFNEKAQAFVETALKDKQPFFLYYAPMTLHGGILPPPEKYSKQFDTGVKFSNEYAGHLLALDEGIKQIFETLEKYGQEQNTLFILSADNGCPDYGVPPYNAPNRGGKGTGWLGGMNVPLIIWKPGVVKPEINREIVSLADVMPTVLETVGIAAPKGIDGKSLLPFLRGDVAAGPRTSLCSSGLHASHWSHFYEGDGEANKQDGTTAPLYVWRIEGDKLLMRITETKRGIYTSLPDGIPARTLLYDLATDRKQMNDLHEEFPEQGKEIDQGIHEWLGGMKEPLTTQQADYKMLLEQTK